MHLSFLVGALGFVVVCAGAVVSFLTLSHAPEIVGATRAAEDTQEERVERDNAVGEHIGQHVASTSDFSHTEAGFEGVEDDTATSAPVIPASVPPQGQRIQWSRYWIPFTLAEEKVYKGWTRPPGPLRVGIQAGHWKVNEVPRDIAGLKSSTGAYGGGYSEQETVLVIAQKVKALLEVEGVIVDLLPATVPVDYYADAFVSIHADGNTSASVTGFKITGPRRDFSERADELVAALYNSYGDATGLRRDANITRRMSGYYAFNWRRYDHALHPMTPAAIIETGFMTSPTDRAVIVAKPEMAAKGIADGIFDFLGM
jgi:hypothetical protein